jgi:uncharacterized protein (DUF58 family)
MLVGQIQSHARGSGDDLYAIRRYHPSDHMRNIDWKATAKSMAMMVREHMREDEWRLTIVFDTASPSGSSARSKPAASSKKQSELRGKESSGEGADTDEFHERFERAVLMAASLANHFILERAEVELITTGEQHDVASGSGYEHLYKILASLATLHPSEPPDDGEPVNGQTRRRVPFVGRSGRRAESEGADRAGTPGKSNGGIAWRLLDDVPVLRDDRRFKVLITPARKGTIPAHVWRSAHVVFMDDL